MLTILDLAELYELEPSTVLTALHIPDTAVETLGDRTPIDTVDGWTELAALEALEDLVGWSIER